MLADYHMHCKYSDDSDELLENNIKSAIEKGFNEICFTDHVDYGIKIDHDVYEKLSKENRKNAVLNVDYPNYFTEIEKFQKIYQNKLVIKKGLEFGIQTHTIPQFQKLFDNYDLDFVILSCHQVGDKEFWTQDFQKGKTPDEYNAEYYEEIYKIINNFKDYSILGHLDLIQRYNKQFEGEVYPFEKNKEIITKILKKVIEDGKGIEVNTSSFAYGLDDLTPSRDILKLYYKLGGKIITAGSDAHKAKDVGRHIKEIYNELKEIGFKEVCTYEKMKPIFHKL